MDRIRYLDKIHASLLDALKIRRLLDLVVDTKTQAPGSDFDRFLLTTRYRMAARGLPVTGNERRLKQLKNAHRGERAFVIGNGPSLNQMDLRLLKDEITFGVNAIYLNYEKMGFSPTYYVVEDVFVAEDRADEINELQEPIKFFGNYLRYCLEDTQNTLWMNIRVNYDEYDDFPNFSRNAARMLWVGGTVSYLSLQLAYFMGFSEVYLVGFDHSYQIPADARVNGGKILSTSDDPNHFDPSYFGKGYRWHDPNVARMEKSLLKARKEFQLAGRKIFNATAGGNLEVFERVDYLSLFR